METTGILQKLGVQQNAVRFLSSGEFVMRENQVNKKLLRESGFRLGKGIDEIEYFLYYSGKFCGVILSNTLDEESVWTGFFEMP
ncbi:hypothetical protein K8I28_14005 [bacterium]|nr:hypothetical protein [bacterium]